MGNSNIGATVTLVACSFSSKTVATAAVTETTETGATKAEANTTVATEAVANTTETGASVAETGATVTETGSTVTETGATVTETGATVAEAGATVAETTEADTRATEDTSASSFLSTSDTVSSAGTESSDSTVMVRNGTVGAGTTVSCGTTVGAADTVVDIVIRLEGNGVSTETSMTEGSDLGDLAIRLGLDAVDGSVASSSRGTVASGNTVGETGVGSVGVSGFVLDNVLDDGLVLDDVLDGSVDDMSGGSSFSGVGNGNRSCGSDNSLEHFYSFVLIL